MLSWVEVDAGAIRWNLEQFRKRLGPAVRLGAVVKSHAYGHGIAEVADLASRNGADWLCVNNVDEALLLREAGHQRQILIMGHVALDRLEDVVRHELRLVVYNRQTLERLDRVATQRRQRTAVHLKLETGTHRQGIPESDVPAFAEQLQRSTWLFLEGVSTHFANIEDTTDHSFAETQIATFSRIGDSLRATAGGSLIRHAACSAAALLFTRTHLDLARIGISMYGLWPSKETYVSCLELGKPTLELKPAMTWKTRIAQITTVPVNSFIGYGCTYRTTRESRVAVLPLGYHEGYSRNLSGHAHVLVRGRRAPLRGRICMNMCMIDLTDIPGVELEEEVVLLGRQGDETLTAEQLASWAGTISYEIVSRIHPSLPRRVVGE